MRRALATAALLAACAAGCLAIPSVATAVTPEQPRVVLILAPYLEWTDVTATSTPTLWSLAEQGAIGAVNSRSRARQAGDRGSPVEGALTISAGAWAVQEPAAPAPYTVSERYEVGTAAQAFRRTTGEKVGDNRIVFLGLPMTQRANDERSWEAILGSLGDAIIEVDGATAAVGNSDVGYVTGEQRRVRPAALAAMNSQGLVLYGDVSQRLLHEDPYAPFGIETDLERYERALANVDRNLDTEDGPSLVVLDPGDPYRAMKFRSQVTEEIYAEHRANALSTLDEVIALARVQFEDAAIMVVSQSAGDPEQGDREGLGPIVVHAPGYDGYLTSDSTQRTGLVTNLDVSATILSLLDVERPVQMLGSAMQSQAGPVGTQARVDWLGRMSETAVAVDAAKPGVVNTFVAFTVLVLVLVAFAVVRSSHWTSRARTVWARILGASLLLALSVPVSSWLMFLVVRWPRAPSAATVSFAAVVAVVWFAALLLWWRAPLRVPVAALSLLTVGVIVADQWMGAPLSFTNFFGYSPLLAARFYGMGNEAAAIVFGAAIVGAALLFDQWPGTPGVRLGKQVGLPLLGLIVIFTAAAPFLGANVGVAIWGVVGFGLAVILANGIRITWKIVALGLLAVVLFIGAFAAVDLLGGGAQTHLGRALVSASQGGFGELWTIVVRKAETNARVLTRTNWAYILVATLAFLGLMRWRPHGDFADTLADNPDFADTITVSLVAGLVAYFTEDSGIVIPALIIFYVGVALAWLMLSRLTAPALPVKPAESAELESGR